MTTETAATQTPEAEVLPPHYAGLNVRMIASSVDMLILMLLTEAPIQAISEHFWKPVAVSIPTVQPVEGMPASIAQMQNFAAAAQDPDWMLQMLTSPQSIFVNVSQMVFLALLSVVCWAHFGATPGMFLLRMRIKDADTGEKLSYPAAFIRFAGYIVSSIPVFLGFLWIVFDKRKQGWHDKLASSVVTLPPRKKRKFFSLM